MWWHYISAFGALEFWSLKLSHMMLFSPETAVGLLDTIQKQNKTLEKQTKVLYLYFCIFISNSSFKCLERNKQTKYLSLSTTSLSGRSLASLAAFIVAEERSNMPFTITYTPLSLIIWPNGYVKLRLHASANNLQCKSPSMSHWCVKTRLFFDALA